MNNNDQTTKVIREELDRLRKEKNTLQKAQSVVENKITSLEVAYKALGGNGTKVSAPRTRTRKNVKIDRQGGQKTYEFIKSRGDKPTTVAMVARKFDITPEAASQRLLNLHAAAKVARIETGQYVAADQITKSKTEST